jgi:hypothetical protein
VVVVVVAVFGVSSQSKACCKSKLGSVPFMLLIGSARVD